MKRFALFLLAGLALVVAGPARASLYEYWQETGQKFIPCNQERKILAAQYGIFDYSCTAEQNNLLEKRLRETDQNIGYSVATNYKTTLQSSMTATQSTIPVSSLQTTDGHTLTMSDLGSVVYLVVEPGSSRQEIIKCTAISSSQWASCTRGLAFYGTSESSVSANRYAHRAGSIVIMTNTHYVFENLVDKDADETVAGDKTFSGNSVFTTGTIWLGDNTTGVDKYVYSNNGVANEPFLRYNESLARWQWSDDGTNTINFTSSSASGLSASSTAGIGITDSFIHVIASSTKGMAFGSDGRLYQMTSSTGGINSDSNGLYVDTTDNFAWTGTHTHAGSNTFNTATTTFNAPIVANATSTMATTTITNGTITTLTLGGQNANTLVDGSDATSLHVHSYSDLITASTTDQSTNFNAATRVFASSTIPAGSLGTDNVVKLRMNIEVVGAANAGPMTFEVNFGGTSVASLTTTGNITVDTYYGIMEAEIFAAGSTSSQEGSLYLSMGLAAGDNWVYRGQGTATIDSSVDQDITVTATKVSGGGTNVFRVRNFYIEVMK